MSDCATMVLVGPPVVTSVQARGDATLIPFPEGSWFTVDALCTIFGITKNYLYVLAHRNRDKLDPPHFRLTGSSRKHHNDRRPRRIFSEKDYTTFRHLFRVWVRKP